VPYPYQDSETQDVDPWPVHSRFEIQGNDLDPDGAGAGTRIQEIRIKTPPLSPSKSLEINILLPAQFLHKPDSHPFEKDEFEDAADMP